MENIETADLYIRMSSEEPEEIGYSISYQEEQLIKYCKDNNIIVKNIYREYYSGKNFERPEFKSIAMNYIEDSNRPNQFLFTRWNRFSTDYEGFHSEIRKLKSLGIEITAIEQPLDISVPENQLMLAIYITKI